MVKELKPLIYSTGFGCEITLERFKRLSVHQIKMLLIKKGVVLELRTLYLIMNNSLLIWLNLMVS